MSFHSLIAHLFSELTSIPLYRCTGLFVHSSTRGQIDCFQVLAIINIGAMCLHYVQDFACTFFQFFQLIPNNEPNGKIKSSFVRYLQTVISVYDILHPNEQEFLLFHIFASIWCSQYQILVILVGACDISLLFKFSFP